MRLDNLTPIPARVLLVNAHAVDIRLPWAVWHQPTGLLQIGAALKRRGCDVRFIDCLGWNPRQRVSRRKVGTLEVEGQCIDLWRFGATWGPLNETVRALRQEEWQPDQVWVSCGQTTWWQGARDLIARIKKDWFPKTRVVLGGVYPSLEPEHATAHSGADQIVVGPIPDAQDEIPDFTLYDPQQRPLFAGIYLYRSQSVTDVETGKAVILRPPEEIAQEVVDKAALGVTAFAFYDEEIRVDQRPHFLDTLKAVAERKLDKTRWVAIGNISPRLIDDEVAQQMGRTHYQQVYLKCDVRHSPDGMAYDTPYEVYQACVEALHKNAGFKPRTGQVTAMLLVGAPYEHIEAVTERLIRLSSVVGSVNLVQYQFSRNTAAGDMYAPLLSRVNGNLDLTTLNGKLYPLSRLTGVPFAHYVELTRLAALLNSKYRSKTFDFLGNSLIARAFQTSLSTGSWNPFTRSGSPNSETIPLTLQQGKKEDHDDHQE